ncbi:PIN domain-containing protein [Halalkalicoccus subterraneus]|uniref:PIN domain-containing protein n=1 Tax=Halalkalicoccus subterraneus TaxID=2675002 RepID=UPI000EFB2FD8|nr:PIN domain-containing protein [Halalkalicoccus subterraneus]
MIEDTSFIIDILHDDSDAVRFLDIIESEQRPERLASITVLELYEAVPQLDIPEERRQKILAVLDSRHAIPGDTKVMRKAGKLSGELITSGQEVDREDCIIAATALLHDEPIVTRNVDHFERIDGLDVRTY